MERRLEMRLRVLPERKPHITASRLADFQDLLAALDVCAERLIERARRDPSGDRRADLERPGVGFVFLHRLLQPVHLRHFHLVFGHVAPRIRDACADLLRFEFTPRFLDRGYDLFVAQLHQQRALRDHITVADMDAPDESRTLRTHDARVAKFHHAARDDRLSVRDEQHHADERRDQCEPQRDVRHRPHSAAHLAAELPRKSGHRRHHPRDRCDDGNRNSAATKHHARSDQHPDERDVLPHPRGDAVERDDPFLARRRPLGPQLPHAREQPRCGAREPRPPARGEIRNAEQIAEDEVAVEAHQRVRVEEKSHHRSHHHDVVEHSRSRAVRPRCPDDRGDRSDEKFHIHPRARDRDPPPARRKTEARRGIHVAHRHEEDENHADLAHARAEVPAVNSVAEFVEHLQPDPHEAEPQPVVPRDDPVETAREPSPFHRDLRRTCEHDAQPCKKSEPSEERLERTCEHREETIGLRERNADNERVHPLHRAGPCALRFLAFSRRTIALDREQVMVLQPAQHLQRLVLGESLAAAIAREPRDDRSDRLRAVERTEKLILLQSHAEKL